MNTPDTVARELERLATLYEAAVDELAGLAERAATAEAAHKVGFAQALLAASGTVAEKEARAEIATSGLLLERRLAERLWEMQRERCRSLAARLSAWQTIGRAIVDAGG